ncbi:MAG: DoxX family protein [Bacteroidota bacterium]|nr:DoxX family protein [Bacteroidota bacterium]
MPDENVLRGSMDAGYIVQVVHLAILILAAAFLSITFLQSGLDKVFDYKSNLSFMKEQFSKTFLKSMIGILLPVILLCELITGFFCVFGAILLYIGDGIYFIAAGFLFAGITLLMLLFGQRVSKQYAGAVSLTGYFIIALIGLAIVVMH